MEVVTNSYIPGDPRLVEQLVYELKSQGIFDQFRKECIADVDTKPAYQNLRQRVEGSVTSFLSQQTWRPDMNKNQVREQLRKNIYESGYLETGVERIVDQVVNPKINTTFLPQVEDVVYRYLGLEKPNRYEVKKELKIDVTDLLPTDLEAISPESDHMKDDCLNFNDSLISETKMEEDESPPFEPIDVDTSKIQHEENSVDSHLSGFSGLQSHDSNPCTESKICQMELSNQDSQVSQNSSESRLSIITSEDNTKMEVREDSNSKLLKSSDSNSQMEIYASKAELITPSNFIQKEEMEVVVETELNIDNNAIDENNLKTRDEEKQVVINTDNKNKQTNEKVIDDKKYSEKKSTEKKSRSSDKYSSREKKDDKYKKSSSSSSNRDKEKSSSKHSSSSKDRDKTKGRKDSKSNSNSGKVREKNENESKNDKDKEKIKNDKEKDKNKSEKDRDRKEKEKDRGDRDKTDKSKSNREKEKPGKDKDKGKSLSSGSSSGSKHSTSKEKDKSSTSSKSDSKKDKDKPHLSNSSSSKDSKSKSGHSESKSKSSSSDKQKRGDKSTNDVRHSSSSSSSKKDKDRKKGSKKDTKDDHYSSKDKKNNRRSTDRDSNDGRSGKQGQINCLTDSNSSHVQKSNQESSNSTSGSGSGDSGASDQNEHAIKSPMKPVEHYDNKDVSVSYVDTQKFKYLKPKFASNFQEARKLMKIRKQLAKLERHNQLSLAQIEVPTELPVINGINCIQKEIKVILVETNIEHINKLNKVEVVRDSKTPEIKESEPPSKDDANPILQSRELSKENWEALEARLAQEMSNINYDSYESPYDDYDCSEYNSFVTSPRKASSNTSEKCFTEETVKEIVDSSSDTPQENKNKVIEENPKKPENSAVEGIEKESVVTVTLEDATENGNKCNKNDSLKANEDLTENNLSTNARDNGKVEDVINIEDDKQVAVEIIIDEGKALTAEKEVTQRDDSENNEPCIYLEPFSPHLNKNLQFLYRYIEKLELDIKHSLKTLQNNLIPVKQRNRKRKLVENVDFRNNNKAHYEQTTDVKKRRRSVAPNPNSVVSKANKVKLCNSSDISPNDSFSLPLSPAESDKSNDRKDEEPAKVKPKREAISREINLRSQRYSSEDLYKPRPVFIGSRRSRGAKIEKK